MNTFEVNENQHILKPLIDKALLDSVVWVSNRGKPQEPDFIMALSTKFVKDFFNILVAIFPNYEFSVLGVYCHQKPIVDIGLTKRPELGDILFVYADRKQGGEVILNSLLLQAKISSHSFFKVPHSETHQLKLYQKWPEFTYCRAGHLNGKKRNILPKSINDGAQYLLINDDPLTNGFYFRRELSPMGCAIPDDILCINDSLSCELINILKFKSGRTFDGTPYKTEDDWSRMIWDLLKIARSKFSRRKNIQIKSFPRSNECRHYFSDNMGNMTLLDEFFDDNINDEVTDDRDVGMSVVLIESRSNGQDEE